MTYNKAAMSNQLRSLMKAHKSNIERKSRIKLRKHLNEVDPIVKTGIIEK